MAWTKGNQPHTTKAQRQRIHTHDNGTCQHCGAPGVEVDHIDNRRGSDYNSDSNLQLLCVSCHKAKTQVEARAARGARQARLTLPRRLHPGLV